jgi:hypothetical protein
MPVSSTYPIGKHMLSSPCDAKEILTQIIDHVREIIDEESGSKINDIGTKYK